jgi:hypothetical protein
MNSLQRYVVVLSRVLVVIICLLNSLGIISQAQAAKEPYLAASVGQPVFTLMPVLPRRSDRAQQTQPVPITARRSRQPEIEPSDVYGVNLETSRATGARQFK